MLKAVWWKKTVVYVMLVVSSTSICLYLMGTYQLGPDRGHKLRTPSLSRLLAEGPGYVDMVTSTVEALHSNESFRGNCSQKTNVVFLKVHKAGSTTIMNIFLRFGFSNQLNIVLPKRDTGNGFNYLGYGKTIDKKNIVPIPQNETYNILCNHVVYNRRAFRRIMPADTYYVGIVREPVSHFLSAAVYYGFMNSIRWSAGMANQTSPSTVFHDYFTNPNKYPSILTTYVRNRMSFDFGLPLSHFDDKVYIEKFIKNLANDFKLVMLMEYFTQSLVLLKRRLCWRLEDIVYIALNTNKRKTKTPVNLLKGDKLRLKLWNYADFRLYAYFEKRFLKQVQSEGPSFTEEVEHFKNVQSLVERFCYQPGSKEQLIIGRSKWNERFYLFEDNCMVMSMNEIPMLQILIQHAKYTFLEKTVTTTIEPNVRQRNHGNGTTYRMYNHTKL